MTESATDRMEWVSAISTRASLEAAVQEVVEKAQQRLRSPAHLGFVFISSAFASEYSRLIPLLKERLSLPHLLGCSGGGVVGSNFNGQPEEIEDEPGISLSLAHLPGVAVHPFHIAADDLPDLDSPPEEWVERVGVSPQDQPSFVLLSDPMSSGINDLLQGLDFAYAGAPKVGGLASSAGTAGHGALFCDDKLYREGTVGVALSGRVVLETIVAQGCRPIGQPLRVIEGERNILLKVEPQTEDDTACGVSKTPLEALQELLQDLSEEDRELAQHSLFVGIAQSEFKRRLEAGDFLIRNLLGVDPRVGAIAVGDRVRPGQRIQFHLRDAEASAEDLETLLEKYTQETHPAAAGALMFSCMGRGEGLYGEPHFDSRLFSRYICNIPISGFFCNGEIGPVGGSTFLHGYTSVFGICREP